MPARTTALTAFVHVDLHYSIVCRKLISMETLSDPCYHLQWIWKWFRIDGRTDGRTHLFLHPFLHLY